MRKVAWRECSPMSSSMRSAPKARTFRMAVVMRVHGAGGIAGAAASGIAVRVRAGICGAGEETIGCS